MSFPQVPGGSRNIDPATLDPIHGPRLVYRTPVFAVGVLAAGMEAEVEVFLPFNGSSVTGGLFRVHCAAFAGPVCNDCGANVSDPAIVQVLEGMLHTARVAWAFGPALGIPSLHWQRPIVVGNKVVERDS